MSNPYFSYTFDKNKAPLPMSCHHIRILRVLSYYPRYREQIRSIVSFLAGSDIHTGTLTPALTTLEEWDFILRTNPNVSRSAGYRFRITDAGLQALRAFDLNEEKMALYVFSTV